MLTHPGWTDEAGLRHGFLDRAESADARAAGVALPILTQRQVHGTTIVIARSGDAPREADGAVSAARGVAVGIRTADCVPALLVARRRDVVAAVHAGWRGAAAGVLEAAIGRLRADFGIEPSALEAALGPAIGPCCYRVGAEVRAAFTHRTGTLTGPAWEACGDRFRLDLRRAARLLLEAAGVGAVVAVGPCTACTPALASYRRDGAHAGRQISFVGLE